MLPLTEGIVRLTALLSFLLAAFFAGSACLGGGEPRDPDATAGCSRSGPGSGKRLSVMCQISDGGDPYPFASGSSEPESVASRHFLNGDYRMPAPCGLSFVERTRGKRPDVPVSRETRASIHLPGFHVAVVETVCPRPE